MVKRFIVLGGFAFLSLFWPVEDATARNAFAAGDQLQQLLRQAPRISAATAYMKYKAGNIFIFDTMSTQTFKRKHILGTINLPYDGRQDLERIRRMKLPFPKSQEIFVYCG
jgi:hypothetical protein